MAQRAPFPRRFSSITRKSAFTPNTFGPKLLFSLQQEPKSSGSLKMSAAVTAFAGNGLYCPNSAIQTKKLASVFSNSRSLQGSHLQFCSKRGGLKRRSLILSTGVSSVTVFCSLLTAESPALEMERLPFKPEGYNYWTWRGRKIHYVEQGSGPAVVLIHGFGASAFHWRYNVPELAKNYKVYAVDLIGFGWSEKAIIEYDATVWRDQVKDFLAEVVKEPAVLVGNSLGGFTALMAASELGENVRGVVLLNSAGQFANQSKTPSGDDLKEESISQKYLLKPLKEALQRVILGFLFWQAKQPSRVESVLKSVYIDSTNVDDYLLESITRPAADPNAGEVYYRLMSRFMANQTKYTLDSVLSKLSCPLLLLWGDLDPWVGRGKAEQIKAFYPKTSVVNLQAGHCPHDEVPDLVNAAMIDWLSSL